jgi:hypothetical protein
MAKKKKAAKKAAKKRSTQKREVLKTRSNTSYAKRSTKGRFKELDDAGRSQRADRTKKAKRKVKSGYGDQGDRRARN